MLHGDSLVVRKNSCHETQEMMTAQVTVEEAARKVRRIVEYEKGRCGGNVERALERTTALWGIEPGAVRSLYRRWRTLRSIKAHVMDRIRQVDEIIQTAADRQRAILEETAQILEERRDPAAGLARKAADLVRKEVA
jgi:ERCC4-type nuclease